MNNEDLFLKNVADYLDIELSDFDRKRILGYLEDYKMELVVPKQPQPEVIVRKQIVYRYVDMVDKRVKNREVTPTVNPVEVIDIVSQKSEIPYEKMKGKRRDGDILVARHIAMYLIRKECDRSWRNTGELFDRDHTTAMHAFHHVETMLEIGDSRYIGLLNEVVSDFPQQKTA